MWFVSSCLATKVLISSHQKGGGVSRGGGWIGKAKLLTSLLHEMHGRVHVTCVCVCVCVCARTHLHEAQGVQGCCLGLLTSLSSITKLLLSNEQSRY